MENMNNQYSNTTKVAWYTIIFMISLLILISLLTGCHVTYTSDPIYEDHPHTTEVYWYTDYELGGTPYFGYWNNFYYYYGVPHFYPWWYYYQFIPPYHYYANTHITIVIESGYYVYKHRGSKFHNIGPNCPTNKGKFIPTIKVKNKKNKSHVFPINWKSYNSTKTTKETNRWDDKNQINNNYNKINLNKGNNGSKRPNKTKTSRKPKR